MKPLKFLSLALLLMAAGLTGSATFAADAPGVITIGNARFTVVAPQCVRMEYAANGQFVDAPSIFAADRVARFTQYRLSHEGDATTIDTGVIRLTYTPDGKAFSPQNLRAVIHQGARSVTWTPGAANPGNLGGTARTLDGAAGPFDLGQGVLSRDRWALVDDSRSPLLTMDWVRSRPADAGTDWYLFGYGDDYKAALRALAAISGPVPLPRRYALGAWYSRYWPYSSTDYRQIVGEYAAHDFPLDNIVMDMDWHRDGWTGWSWNRTLLPDAEQLLAWFHQQGLHVTLNLHPADGVSPQEDQYAAFMRDMGHDPASGKTLPFDAGDKRYMDALLRDVMDPLAREGADFWWLDWQQYPYTRSVPDLTNLFWLNTVFYQHTGQDGQRGLSFSRWAGWGDQRHPIHFSGDANTNWPMLAFEVPFTSTAGNVGCFFWSHDIGGHQGGRNEESYTRWVQFGATSPALRSHSTRSADMDRRPWTYPKWAEDSMRVSFHLRSQLFPYIYTSAAQTCRDTVPLDRPLYIDYPRVEAAYHNAQEYLFGDDLLVAPIVSPGVGPGRVAHQVVWFPPGMWYDAFTGEQYRGGSEELVSADMNEFPLYVRGGVPIPLQPYRSRMATAPLTQLIVRCYPGAEGQTGRFTLYEDDGETTAYQRGASATTPLSYVRHGNTITVTVGPTRGHYAGQVAQRGVAVELPDTLRATRATVDGKPVAVLYDAANFVTRITVRARYLTRGAQVVVQAAPADFASLHRRAVARRMAGILGKPVGGNDVRAMLVTATADSSLAPAAQEALLAAAGVGLVHKNEGAYYYHGTVSDCFYAPGGLVDGGTVTTGAPTPLPVRADTALRVAPPGRHGHVTFQVAGRAFQLPNDPLLSADNVALTARVTASSAQGGYSPQGAVDGTVGGYPADQQAEWASNGENVGATLRLEWDTAQTVDRIVLYDRPNPTDQITSATITFSDGSTLGIGELPNDASRGYEVRFPPKTITSLTF